MDNYEFYNFEFQKSDQKLASEIKRSDIINNKKMLNIFDALSGGKSVLDSANIKQLSQKVINFAAQDEDTTSLSRKEAKKLMKSLNIDAKVNDFRDFLKLLNLDIEREISVNKTNEGIQATTEITPYNSTQDTPDGILGGSEQEGAGDCYLLASIYAIRESMHRNILTNSIKKDTSGYTITFPGALAARKALLTDNRIDKNKMYITGKYHISNETLQEAIRNRAGDSISTGDADINLLELAFEEYRKQVYKTVHENNLSEDDTNYIAGLEGDYLNGSLEGGSAIDAIFVLTGKKSTLYFNENPEELSFDDAEKYEYFISEVKSISLDSTTRDQLIQLLKQAKGWYIATCSFKMEGHGGHTFAIKTINGNVVTLINPWNSKKVLKMDLETFRRKVYKLTVA